MPSRMRKPIVWESLLLPLPILLHLLLQLLQSLVSLVLSVAKMDILLSAASSLEMLAPRPKRKSRTHPKDDVLARAMPILPRMLKLCPLYVVIWCYFVMFHYCLISTPVYSCCIGGRYGLTLTFIRLKPYPSRLA